MIPLDLFERLPQVPVATQQQLAPGAMLLRAYALSTDVDVLQAIESVIAQAPLRHMQTPGGYTMSVATTSCGPLGGVSDALGYRYAVEAPLSSQQWPMRPASFLALADGEHPLLGRRRINLTFRRVRSA